jgi:hypothetical protein
MITVKNGLCYNMPINQTISSQVEWECVYKLEDT